MIDRALNTTPVDRWTGVIELIEQITAEEGASVTFVGSNPDFNGMPNEAVTVIQGEDWQDVTYRADTLADCLRAALAHKGENTRPAAPSPSPELGLLEGEYAIVEVLGHRTIVGRVEEIERFGSKLMSIQPIFSGKLLDAVMIGGGSIYQFTPCSRATAIKRAPTDIYNLPASIRAAMPQEMLPAPANEDLMRTMMDTDDDGYGDDMPF